MKRAEAQADERVHLLESQQLQQLGELQELLAQCQKEAAARVEQCQLECEIRVDVAARRGLEALKRADARFGWGRGSSKSSRKRFSGASKAIVMLSPSSLLVLAPRQLALLH